MILCLLKDEMIFQAQIRDFLGEPTLHIKRLRSCSKKLSKLRERLEKIKRQIRNGIQKTLLQFINRERPKKYVPRLKTPICKPYNGERLSPTERATYANIKSYRGELPHLFLFYPWDRLSQFESADREYRLDGIMKAHIIMCKKRLLTYTDLITDLHEKPMLMELCGFRSVPTHKVISSENPLFREILDDFHKIYGFYPGLMSVDKGSDSEDNRNYCEEREREG